MWIENAWYVAAWSNDIAPDTPFARVILGEPVVFYRKSDGSVAALQDRCCHRHAPLSKGRIEGDDLRCMYHGVKFAPSGACVEIPGAERVPKNYGVRRFPAVERQNLIWIWMGDPDRAEPATIIDVPYLDDARWPYRGGYLHYQASYRLAVDNFLDFSHLPYVHEQTIGTAAYAESRPAVSATDFGLHIENLAPDRPSAPMFQKFGGFEGNVDRWSLYDFHIRGNCLLGDFGSISVGNGGHAGDRKGAIEFRHFSAMTPETETTSHYHFAQTRNFGIGVDGMDDQILSSVLVAFHEDKEIIEAQQRVVDLSRDAPMLPIEVDKALIQVRRRTDQIIAAERAIPAAAE